MGERSADDAIAEAADAIDEFVGASLLMDELRDLHGVVARRRRAAMYRANRAGVSYSRLEALGGLSASTVIKQMKQARSENGA